MRRNLRLAPILTFLVVAAAIATIPPAARAACDLTGIRTDELPPGDRPIEVQVGYFILDFLGVDDPNQNIEIDIQGRMEWTDPRLARFAGCRAPITEIWFPRLTLLNSSNLRRTNTQARDQVQIGPGGAVTYLQRFTGDVSSYHSLRQFPFDSHVFNIRIAALEEDAAELLLVADAEPPGIAGQLNIEGWTISGARLVVGTAMVDSLQREVATAQLMIDARRDSAYYVFRILSLLVLVVAMSWAVFWVPPDRFEFQIGLGATSMLTAIAFNLSLASSLPKLGYLTVLDKMIIWAVFLVFLSIVEALFAGRMVINKQRSRALRLDRISRFAFPLMLFFGWAVVYLLR